MPLGLMTTIIVMNLQPAFECWCGFRDHVMSALESVFVLITVLIRMFLFCGASQLPHQLVLYVGKLVMNHPTSTQSP